MKENVKAFVNKDWTCEEKVLACSLVFLVGLVLGFLLAPDRRKLIYCGNNNDNHKDTPDEKEKTSKKDHCR